MLPAPAKPDNPPAIRIGGATAGRDPVILPFALTARAVRRGVTMPKNFVYFDLETQRSAGDVGGWDKKDKMGMSIGVIYSTGTGKYEIFRESEVDDLIATMSRADLVIGFNHVEFDYAVLQGYSMWDVGEQMRSFDLLLDLEKRLGHRIKLDDIASASLGTGKTADGLDAIRWWREGKVRQIAEYCCFDVKCTMLVHEFGVQHGYVRYNDRFGAERTVEVQWPDWR